MNVSTLILTRNEEDQLPDCLASLAGCDDILVLDSHSTDRTVAIAEAHGARVIQRPFDTFADQRNHGLEHGGLRHDWVLHLDADERLSPELRDEMQRTLPTATVDAFRVPSRMIFQDRWLKHAGMYPTYQVRLGRRDRLRFRQVGHGQRETLPAERLGTCEHALIHYSFAKGLDDWFQRHNRYSADEARAMVALRTEGGADWTGLFAADPVRRRRALKQASAHLPARALGRFIYMYLIRGGFLDGHPGLDYCRLLALYETMITLKVRELQRHDVHPGKRVD